MLRTASALFFVSAAMWLAFAVAGGLAAAAIFPKARDLELSLAGYEAFLAAHPSEGKMLIGGFFAERVFILAQWPRIGAAALAAVALAVHLRLAPAEPLRRTRLAALAVAGAALLFGSFWVIGDFRARDAAYRDLARTPGSVEKAIALKPELDAAHALASRTMTVEVGAVLALLALSAFARGGQPRRA